MGNNALKMLVENTTEPEQVLILRNVADVHAVGYFLRHGCLVCLLVGTCQLEPPQPITSMSYFSQKAKVSSKVRHTSQKDTCTRPKRVNQWYFGMKMHIGVDAGSGMVHSLAATSANVHDVDVTSKLIREDDNVVYGDSGYLGLPKRPAIRQDNKKSNIDYRINRRPTQIKTTDNYVGINWEKESEHQKSSVRSKVEHSSLIVKRDFGYKKVAYRGQAKNLNRFSFLFVSANILMYLRGGHKEPIPLMR